MFARPLRLTDTKQYGTIFRRGTWVRGRTFSLVFLPAPRRGKIGFIVTKKVAKSAVVRNQTKRQIRAALQRMFQKPEFSALLENYALVVVIHRTTTGAAPQELAGESQRLLEKLREAVRKA